MQRHLILVVLALSLASCAPAVPRYEETSMGTGIRKSEADSGKLKSLKHANIALVLSQNTTNNAEYRDNLIKKLNTSVATALSSDRATMEKFNRVFDPKAIASDPIQLLGKYFDQGIAVKTSIDAAKENSGDLIVLYDRWDKFNNNAFNGHLEFSAKGKISFIDQKKGEEFYSTSAEIEDYICERPSVFRPDKNRETLVECFLLMNDRILEQLDSQLQLALGAARAPVALPTTAKPEPALVVLPPAAKPVVQPASTGQTVADRLRVLQQLKEEGVITEKEYQQKKAKLLEQF